MKAKLSEIWAWAAKELDQITGDWGFFNMGRRSEACALGAIQMYRTDKRSAVPSWDSWAIESYLTALAKFAEAVLPDRAKEIKQEWKEDSALNQRLVWTIINLNDDDRWTFAMFSKKAKELEEAGVIT